MDEFQGTTRRRVTGKNKAAWIAQQMILLDKNFTIMSAGPSNHERNVYAFTIDRRMTATFDRLVSEYKDA
jgi:hypothetical protein